MRRRLERLAGQRLPFEAIFMRFGKTQLPDGRIKRYMLIWDVKDASGRKMTPHLWMPLRPEDYVWTPLCQGDAIRFDAEVASYTKGNPKHRKRDYGLCRPRNVQRIEVFEQEQGA